MMVRVDDHEEETDLPTTVAGGGVPGTSVPAFTSVDVVENGPETTINAGGRRLVLRRLLAGPVDVDPARVLTGLWPGQDDPVTLAYLT